MAFSFYIFINFFITQFSEISFLVIITRFQNTLKKSLLTIIALSFLFNSFSHPLAVFLYLFLNLNYFAVEGIVIFIETIFYKIFFDTSWKKSWAIAFLANITSILVGLLINLLLKT
jgi:hypothetical protein